MNRLIKGMILGAALLLATILSQLAQSQAEDRPKRAGAVHHQRSSESADFEVPAMWEYSGPLIAPEKRAGELSRAQKDPTLVFHDGKWHVFMTVKLPGRSAIEYCWFEKWEEADRSQRTILRVSNSDYYCAPQVFYFTPQKKWYLIYQMRVPGVNKMWVAYSTTSDIADPDSWTPARPMLDGGAQDPRQVGDEAGKFSQRV